VFSRRWKVVTDSVVPRGSGTTMTNFLSHDDAVMTFIDYDEVERRA